MVSRRAEIDVLTKRRPEQQLEHLRSVEPFRRLASDAKLPERPVSLEQPKLVSNLLDLETRAPRRRDVVTAQLGDRLMNIRPDAQLWLPSRVPHSHQRAAKVDRLLWKFTDPSYLAEREVTSPECRGAWARSADRDHRMHRQRDSGDALEPTERRIPVTQLDKALEVLSVTTDLPVPNGDGQGLGPIGNSVADKPNGLPKDRY